MHHNNLALETGFINDRYANEISERLLGTVELVDKTFIDLGPGVDETIPRYVLLRGGLYIPLDIRASVLEHIRGVINEHGMPFVGIHADVGNIPFIEKSLDIVHSRFVLSRLERAEQERAVAEAVRIARRDVIFVEADLHSMTSFRNSDFVRKLKDVLFTTCSRLNIDVGIGHRLPALLSSYEATNTVQVQYHRREEGLYREELGAVLLTLLDTARNILGDHELSGSCKELAIEFSKSEIYMVPPAVVTGHVLRTPNSTQDVAGNQMLFSHPLVH